MVTSALRPRSVTEIVDAAFQILRAHYAQFVMCSALGYLPWLVLQLIFISDPERFADRTNWLVSFLAIVGIWLNFALMSAVIIGCASQAYLGEPIDVAATVRGVVRKLPRVMMAALVRYTMLFLGLLAFLVGALYVAARFFAVTPAIILEDAGVSRALSRSSELSQGRKQHILNTLGLVAIIYWAVGAGITFVSAAIGNVVIQALVGAFYTILAYPVIAITETLLYYDARIQSEGLDIALMADELGVTSPTGPASS